ncbi:MAG: hypothetical protein WD512_17055 [Candidatus Paceibacterota bacterium]
MRKKRPVAPPAELKPREAQPKKRKRAFKQGDFVRSIEDNSLIVIVTKDTEPTSQAFHGTCIRSDKRKVGEHERFWLKNLFEIVEHIHIECM